MTTKEELRRGRRVRYMVEGVKGSGKTTIAVAVARDRADAGQEVLYLDMGNEAGASLELETLTDKQLGHVDYKPCATFKQSVEFLKPGYGLVIVDAGQHIQSIANEVACDVLVAVGADKDEQSGKGILKTLRNIDGVANASVLPFGKGTGMVKEYIRAFFKNLFDLNCDVLFLVNTRAIGTSDKFVDALGGNFDVCVEVERVQGTDDGRTPKWEYRFVIDKVRGVTFNEAKPHTWQRGENVLRRVEEITRPPPPKPPMPMACAACNKVMPLGGLEFRECAGKGHALKPAEEEARAA